MTAPSATMLSMLRRALSGRAALSRLTSRRVLPSTPPRSLISSTEIGRASGREGRDWSSDVCSSDLGGEVQAVVTFGLLASSNCFSTGDAAEQHDRAFCDHAVNVAAGFVRARGTVTINQSQGLA